MRAKEFLMQYKNCCLLVEDLLSQVDELTDRAMSIQTGIQKIRASGSASVDRMEYRIACMMDKKQELEQALEAQHAFQDKIEGVINSLPDAGERTILFRHYILLWKFADIAESMGKSDRWVHWKHKRGLSSVEKVLADREDV